MIDNTRLSRDQRCAIVLNNFDNRDGTADLTLVYFREVRGPAREALLRRGGRETPGRQSRVKRRGPHRPQK
jgi:hypothetical protein